MHAVNSGFTVVVLIWLITLIKKYFKDYVLYFREYLDHFQLYPHSIIVKFLGVYSLEGPGFPKVCW